MRIALFTETFLPKIDGIVTRLSHTIPQLIAAGDTVLVVAPTPAPSSVDGAEVLAVPGFRFPLYPELRIAPPRRSILRGLERFRPDLVHVVNPAVLGLAGIRCAGRLGVPLVASYHTHVPRYLRHYRLGALEGLCWKVLRAMHNRADLNLCTSSVMLDELRAQRIERLALWPRAVDTERFHPTLRSEAVRAELSGGRPGGPLLLYVGRLAPEKELDRARRVLEARPEATLAIVGDGPDRDRLERHFAGTRTRFVGYRKGEALAAAFASADALIFPSRTETLGLVVLEAMAAGCPVVAARAGGITDIVTDGVNGCLFDPRSDADLVAVTRHLLENPEFHQALSERARREAERWSWPEATAELRRQYRSVIDGAETVVET